MEAPMKNLCLATVLSLCCVLLWSAGCAVPALDPESGHIDVTASESVEAADLAVPIGDGAQTAAACPANNVNQWLNQGYVCSNWVFQGDCGAQFCSEFACGCHNNRCLATERLQAVSSKRSCTRTDDPTIRFEFAVNDEFVSCNGKTCPF
jgi:hypothetical protein